MTEHDPNAILAEAFDLPDDDEQRSRFAITSPELAEWAFRKLRTVLDREAENAAIVDAEVRRLYDWLQHHPENAALARDRAFFETLLEEWWRDQLAKELAEVGGDWSKLRRKSRSLPSGTVSGRYVPPVPEYDDPDAAVAWFEAHELEGVVAVEKKPRKADVKNLVDQGVLQVADGHLIDPATGEVVPGITVPEVADPLDAVNVKASPK